MFGAMGGAVLGLMTGGAQNERNISANKASQRKQGEINKSLAMFNHNMQMNLYNKTNYENQVEHMKKAGLNPALMYGSAGASGQTSAIGAQGVGMPDMSQRSQGIEGMMAGIQMEAVRNQNELQKAQARELNAKAENQELDNETKRTFGQDADKFEASNRKDKALIDGQFNFSNTEEVRNSNLTKTNYGRQLENNWTINNVERLIKENGMDDELDQIAYKTVGMALDNELKELNKELTSEQTRKIWHDIWQGWTREGFNGLGKIINASILKNLGGGKNTKTEYYDGSDKSWMKKTIIK